ncbi:MAG: hypothetical protein MSS48_00955 [Clostridiales bacterium]|nr:hypothetical protein [Clostridiales bacterium]
MSGKKKWTLIIVAAVVVLTVGFFVCCHIRYPAELQGMSVAELEKKLNTYEESRFREPNVFCDHLRISGVRSQNGGQDIFVALTGAQYYLSDKGVIVTEADLDGKADLYSVSMKDGRIVSVDPAYDDMGERAEDYPVMMILKGKLLSIGSSYRSYVKDDLKEAVKRLKTDKVEKQLKKYQ